MYQNRVTLIGFLGKDAESRSTRTQQTPFVVLSLATKRSWKDRESGERHSQTEWHRCIVWGRLAEYAATLTKGAHVQVEGDLRHREYTPQPKNGSDNGVTLRTVAEIRVTSITKLDRPATTAGSSSPASSAANPNPDPAIAAAATAEEVPF